MRNIKSGGKELEVARGNHRATYYEATAVVAATGQVGQ